LEAYAVSSHPARGQLHDGPFLIENRPKPLANPGGPLSYHLNQVWYGLSLVVSAFRYGAQVAVFDSGSTHWFVLAPLALARVRVVPCLHNTIWPNGPAPAGLVKRAVRTLDGWFWRAVAATLCVSPECQRQIEALSATRNPPVFQFRGQYDPETFAAVDPPPPHDRAPFRVLYVGRVVRGKGVFDLLEIARRLKRDAPNRFAFDVCGGGPDLDALSAAAREGGLGELFQVYGRVSRQELMASYGRCHVVIVPTRSSFCEGLPATASEAILAGRPVLTSRLSNVVDVFEGAVVEARPDDPDSYADCLLRLTTDRDYYLGCCRASTAHRGQFYDRDRGWAAAIERAFRSFDATLLAPLPSPPGLS